MKVLSQVSSASACERNWSTFEFIHTKKRNRLSCKKARDIVFVHTNLRLKDNMERVDYEEQYVKWDDDSDSHV